VRNLLLLLFIGLLGCGLLGCGDDSGADDAGGPDAGGIDAAAGTEPAPPAPPELGACPAGWSRGTVGEVAVCDPGDPTECPAGEERFHGGCGPVGACPAGDFADDLPATGVRYVAPGGTGSGTRDAPFGTLAAAMSGAPAGTVVALAKGRYPERVTMRAGVTLRGACAAETVLEAAPATIGATYAIRSSVADAVVSDLSIEEVEGAGVVLDGGSLRLERVRVAGARSYGVVATIGTLAADRLVVRDTRLDGDGSGFGVVVSGGAATLVDTLVAGNHGIGLVVAEGAAVTLERVVSRAQVPVGDDAVGIGVDGAGSSLTATDILLEDARGTALGVTGGATATVDGLVVRHVRADGARMGFALSAVGESTADVRRAWFHDAQGTAAAMTGRGRLVLTDVVIDATVAPPSTPGWAVGASVQDLGTLELERVLITGAGAAAVAAVGTDATELGDLHLVARDLTLRDSTAAGLPGVGLYLNARPTALLERVRIARSIYAGMVVGSGAVLTASDLEIRESQPAADGQWGRALEVVDAEVTLDRALFQSQYDVGLLFSQARGTLRDIQVLDTAARACATDSCAGAPGGIGLGAYDDSRVSVERFLVAGAPLCGVQLARSTELDLRSGVVRDAAVGACVQVAGYDLERLADDVTYEDTPTRIDVTDLYVPEVSDPLE